MTKRTKYMWALVGVVSVLALFVILRGGMVAAVALEDATSLTGKRISISGPSAVEADNAPAATWVVTSNADSGPGTLRQALVDAGTGDIITFDPAVFPPGSPATIVLISDPLPDINQGSLTIDASNAGVILNGSALTNGDGLHITSDGNVVRGLQILYFPGAGIRIDSASHNLIGGDNATPGGACTGACNLISGNGDNGVSMWGSETMINTVSGNYIGTNTNGTAALGNVSNGVFLVDGAQFNVIGGTTSSQRNLISGSSGNHGIHIMGAHRNTVIGNYIGVDVSGTYALGNYARGVGVSDGSQYNTIGGDSYDERNLISGNDSHGISISGSETMNNTISGNYIGTDAAGMVAVPNGGNGVTISDGAQDNTIGGDTDSERNVISGNNGTAVEISGSGTTGNTVSGNFIGTNSDGTSALLNNNTAIFVNSGASYNLIGGDTAGERNLISGNLYAGIHVTGSDTVGNVISGNFIGTDISGGVAIPNQHFGIEINGGANNNRIGGVNATPGSACGGECNLISGNGFGGVNIRDSGTMGNTVSGNYIGTDIIGTTALGNSRGVNIDEEAQHNVIGGATPGERNLISGNNENGLVIRGTGTGSNTVIGNYIGTDASGTEPLGNSARGVWISDGASSNVIGGDNATPGGACGGECNLISGNGGDGVNVEGSGTMSNTVSGNYIGTDATGMVALSNSGSGAIITGGVQHNTIGGDTDSERNVISGNGHTGMQITGSGTVNNTVSGNFIGTSSDGTSALLNNNTGFFIGGGASYNLIGGDTAGERNLISGNLYAGIHVTGSDTVGNVISGNFIGTDISGGVAIPNHDFGVQIDGGANDSRIGGVNAAPGGACGGECNLISGNGGGLKIDNSGTMSNTVSGNYIGTDAGGTAAIPNGENGIEIGGGAGQNLIGGDNATPGWACTGACNLISGNGWHGIELAGSGTMNNHVAGNIVGLTADGTASLGNAGHGVLIQVGAQDNVIGGTTEAERNVIGSNYAGSGVRIESDDTSGNIVTGNFIGTDIHGAVSFGNAHGGIAIAWGANHNRIGGTTAGERNLISGNEGNGIVIYDSGTASNTVSGNYIGTDVTGMVALSNSGSGVTISDGAQDNTIGGDTDSERNLISGNGGNGIDIYGADTTSNTLRGNLIGTNADGTGSLGNGIQGIWLGGGAHHNVIGGSTSQDRNVISGNRWGVGIEGAGTTNNRVAGNFIGTTQNGAAALSNTNAGVVFYNGSQQNVVGPGNTLAYNGTDGVVVYGSGCLSNTITQNSIHSNSAKGIALVEGGNAELPSPIITQLTGGNAVNGKACANCTVEIFSDNAEEGQAFEGSTTADGAGLFSFSKPSGFTYLNVTATATDAAGNTSEFSAEAPPVPPTITQLKPNQGSNSVPAEIAILGSHFSSGITATLDTVPPVALSVRFGDSTQIVVVVPASLPPGRYDLTVVNPGGGSATLPEAYEVYGPASDDLFGYPDELWTDPQSLRAGEPSGVGLVVHRQGGDSVLTNVLVRFYRGNPSQGGAAIGDGVIPLLSPNSSASTPKVSWTPPGAQTHDLYAVIDPDNAISESIEANNIVSRTVTILGAAGDTVAPHVDSFSIDDGASTSYSRDVTLDATASDNPGGSGVTSLLYLEFEYSQAANQWFPVQNSGWLTYTMAQTNYPWTLLPSAGMKYMQAWAADQAGNISLYPYQAYINYMPPVDQVLEGQTRVYRYTLAAGQLFTVTVTPVTGDPDLYVWPPDFPERPPWISDLSSGVDQVAFMAPVAGVYQIEVYGFTAADYQINIETATSGTHRKVTNGQANADKPQRSSPAVSVSSEPGVQIALPPPPSQPRYMIYLPVILNH